jgi:ParB family transcriptional regulator, chromosome partitioning protein
VRTCFACSLVARPELSSELNFNFTTQVSDKLTAELTAYRTSALRNELAEHPGTAFLALVHALTLDLFFPGSEASCLEITPKRAWLTGHAPGIDESLAEQRTAERHAAWGKRLPEAPEALWDFVCGLSHEDCMSLLAHCVSLTANAIRVPHRISEGREAHAAILARAVNLDMAGYWQPTAANYLTRVSKERILEALREGRTSDVEAIARLKKPAMAEAAEKALLGKGWLPALLRLAA